MKIILLKHDKNGKATLCASHLHCKKRLVSLTTALSSELQAINKSNTWIQVISLDGSITTTEYATRAVKDSLRRKFTYVTDRPLGHRWST